MPSQLSVVVVVVVLVLVVIVVVVAVLVVLAVMVVVAILNRTEIAPEATVVALHSVLKWLHHPLP